MMTDEERELDLRLGDALARVDLLTEIVAEATVICQDVEHGRYGDALMHNQKFWAKLEKLRQYEEKGYGTE